MKKEIENISKIILQCIEEDEGLKMIWNEDTLCFGIRTLKKSCLSLFWWSDKGGIKGENPILEIYRKKPFESNRRRVRKYEDILYLFKSITRITLEQSQGSKRVF